MADLLYVVVSATAVLQTILATIFIFGLIYRMKKNDKNVCIIVLGDIGRSPRMQYHANSYAKENFSVNVLGFKGAKPIQSLRNNANITFTYLLKMPQKPSWLPGIVFYISKTAFQSFQLFFVMTFVIDKPDHFLIQNPPSIPTIAIAWLVCCIKGCRMIIDWHNYGYTILALNVKSLKHPLVQIAKLYEEWFGKTSSYNICVTEAMKNDLEVKWNIKSSVLYDRPPDFFKETSVEEKHLLFQKLSKEYKEFAGDDNNSTLFTKCVDGKVVYRPDRPAIIISSTSWTEDEDFSILLKALEIYEHKKSKQITLPKLCCIITGKGPMKDYYKSIIAEKNFEHIEIVTPWLTAEDYPLIIGCGDLGICLHTSSSGLDLPMKVVDMFGCGLPVSAVQFSCLHELVKDNINGLIFTTSNQLAEQITELFSSFPSDIEKLLLFRNNLKNFQKIRWHQNWKNVVLPLIKN